MPKLLIVDDDEYIRTGLKHLIDWEELGIEIVGVAEGGREAYRIFQDCTPQIVLTDIRMPDGDGLELIRNIREKGWDTNIIVLSGYDDFSYVRQAMRYQVEDYLLKPVDSSELKEIVKSCCEQLEHRWMNEQMQKESFQLLRHNVLVRWAENRIEYDQLREKLDFLNVNIGNNRLIQAAVIVWKDFQEGILSAPEQKFRSFAILNSMEEIMAQEQRGIAFINPEKQIVCIFIGENNDPEAFVKENLAWMKATSNSYSTILKTPWYCAFGTPVKQSNALHTSYRDALRLLDLIEQSGPVKCLERSSLTINLEQPVPQIADKEKIVPLILAGRREAWKEALNYDFQWALSQPDPVAASKYTAAEWMVTIKETLRRMRLGTEQNLGNHVLTDIFSESTISAIKLYIVGIMDQLEQTIKQHTSRKKNSLIHEVETYLKLHYDQQLSLQILADQFNVSSIYLGRLFKAETGEYFSDYINRLRIEEGKRLLKESHMKATEIAEKIGFLDPNYFYRKFKQTVGLSPTEYRNISF